MSVKKISHALNRDIVLRGAIERNRVFYEMKNEEVEVQDAKSKYS